MEDWKGEEFPPVVAVLGFTTILGAFSGIGVWGRLSCGRVVLDGSFNPTYGLSLCRRGTETEFFPTWKHEIDENELNLPII